MGQLLRMAKVGVPLALAVSLAACGSGPKSGAKSHSGSKSHAKATTTTVPPTTTTIAKAVASTLSAAVTAYESGQGVKASEYTIDRLETSGVDPTWALFTLLPASSEVNFQSGYGFAHMTSENWSVVAFGSSGVGCPPGATGNKAVPAKVLAGFFLTCSTAAHT
jgi:hypothetical protein